MIEAIVYSPNLSPRAEIDETILDEEVEQGLCPDHHQLHLYALEMN
jgi:hypothetical protein